MKITLKKKIEMCEEHIIKGKSLPHVSEMYKGYTQIKTLLFEN